MKQEIKLIAGTRYVPGTLETGEKLFSLKFKYNKRLVKEVKYFQGRKWDPARKVWTFPITERNRFQLERMLGKNPYAPYDTELKPAETKRAECKRHQQEMTAHVLARRQCIIAGEMGIGKTLAIIEALEQANVPEVWYVAPKWALHSVKLELKKWRCSVNVNLMTYDGFKKRMSQWRDGDLAPQAVVFDECHMLKNINSQRTQYALALTKGMREDHLNPYIILMSGTPAPKNPTDWYALAEIARPGFLIEGDIFKFKETLAVVKMEESLTGGMYPKLVTWRSSTSVCDKCGEEVGSVLHDPELRDFDPEVYHDFIPATNEVERLYRRLKGLVLIKLKKDCLADLPEKVYQEIELEPSHETLNLAKLIMAKSASAVKTLTMMRELSDGFQYKDIAVGKKRCTACLGDGQVAALTGEEDDLTCPLCNGSGEIDVTEREAKFIGSPKINAYKDLLEMHEDVSRTVTFAGFTGSIDICCETAEKKGWTVIRVDGRGLKSTVDGDPIEVFQSDTQEKLAFIAHPGSGGMGLTLTKSPSIIFYSNDFNGQNRMQAEDRIHRPSMDMNKSPVIYDLLHLPSDRYILESTKLKKDLQSVTLGELQEVLSASGLRYV